MAQIAGLRSKHGGVSNPCWMCDGIDGKHRENCAVGEWLGQCDSAGVCEIYVCKCGLTHAGPWAIYDYAHHNCPHVPEARSDARRLNGRPIVDEDREVEEMCMDCGETLWRPAKWSDYTSTPVGQEECRIEERLADERSAPKER